MITVPEISKFVQYFTFIKLSKTAIITIGGGYQMKKINEIKEAITKVAAEYFLKRVKLFGSYAEDRANENSDIDLLVEFNNNDITLLTLTGLKYRLEDLLNISVDIVEMPVPEDSLLQIERTLNLYEQ